MKYLLILTVSLMLGACGVETATTAASVAAAKAKELEEAKKTQAKIMTDLNAASELEQKRVQEQGDH